MIIIWGSWLAFDAGTTLALNFQSVMALSVTNLCAASGCITWLLLNYYETRKFSVDVAFMGSLAGLVMITPSAGFIDMPTALLFGVVGALVCRQALRIKFTKFAHHWRWVDNGDTFATHLCGGILATIMTGLFAQKEVAAYGGMEVAGGVIFDGHISQLWIQIVEALVGATWAFTISFIIMAILDSIPGLEVLAVDREIMEGLDLHQTEEHLCSEDYADEANYRPIPSALEFLPDGGSEEEVA
ncbi:ammonium transporter, Amt family [Geosmithia morbida]|uniref:Ammonium transporter, Amt family n=1 Tax=Geosmithia morbida TaxID=1094350 RepID=A0A9P4YQT1_9HYPO|nr:ammonium transporter, Amt family [Geosmithia morbida]KAF4120867.1 ammonium transporter, Amt family [Geosmithia morbida]